MLVEYSRAERELITALGYERYLSQQLSPPSVYGEIFSLLRLEGGLSPAKGAFIRGYQAIQKCSPYRLTPEFDALITFNKLVPE